MIVWEREYLVTILIMPERHFHFLSVVGDRLQNGPATRIKHYTAFSFPDLFSADWVIIAVYLEPP